MHKINELETLHQKCGYCLGMYKAATSEADRMLWMDEYVFYAMQVQSIHLRKMLEPATELVHG